MSVELSISGGNIDKRCESVINLLKKNNIYSKVTPNVSICDDEKTELGCTIRLPRKYGDEDKNLLIKDWCLIKNAVSNVGTYGYVENMTGVYWII